MTSAPDDHHRQVRALFEAAFDLPPGERTAFVATQPTDQAVRAEVLSLLQASDDSRFLEAPLSPSTGIGSDLGLQVGRYRLLREIGRGGMGVVYLAVRNDDVFDKVVALKVIGATPNPQFVERFKKERQILAGVDHPNIARILDGGDTDDGLPFYVMEYVPGDPIDVHCAQVAARADARVRLAVQVCEAVDYLHEHAIIHRDLKPSNILVTPEGQARLLDFGIARLQTPEGPSAESSLRPTLLLTPGYASPEQVRGVPLTRRSDVYSLGAVLYELLTGQLPFVQGDGTPDLARQLSGSDPVAPGAVVMSRSATRRPGTTTRRFSGDLDTVVLTALKGDPSRRYPSARMLADELTRVLDGLPIQARSDSWRYVLGHFLDRHRVVAALAVLLLLAVVGAGGLAVQARLDRIRAAAAENELERLVTVLNARVERWASPGVVESGEKVADVERARRVLDSETLQRSMTTGERPQHVQAVVSGIRRFLDRADELSADEPSVRKTIADTYRHVGDFEARAPAASAPAGRREAADSYQRAAAIATSVVSVDPGWAEAQLRDLSARLKALGVSLTVAVGAGSRPVPPAAPGPAAAAKGSIPRVGGPSPAPDAQAPVAGEATQFGGRLAFATRRVESARSNVESLRTRLVSQGHLLSPSIENALAQMNQAHEAAQAAAAGGAAARFDEAMGRLTYTLGRVVELVGR